MNVITFKENITVDSVIERNDSFIIVSTSYDKCHGYGWAKLHEDDKDFYSKRVGSTIAFYRACVKTARDMESKGILSKKECRMLCTDLYKELKIYLQGQELAIKLLKKNRDKKRRTEK